MTNVQPSTALSYASAALMSGTMTKESLDPGSRAWMDGALRTVVDLAWERTAARTAYPASRALTRTRKPRCPVPPVMRTRGRCEIISQVEVRQGFIDVHDSAL